MHPPTAAGPLLVLLLAAAWSGCTGDDDMGDPGADAPATLTVTSTAFAAGARIPAKHTCDGANVKPAIAIDGSPEGTETIAVIMDDPDAPRGTFLHYTVWDLPAEEASWPEGADLRARGGVEGATSADGGTRVGYVGPCPPPPTGEHRYFFRVYALDTTLGLESGADRARLEAAMRGHVLATGTLMGVYARTA